MASPAVLLVPTESDISKQISKIERLEEDCQREKEAWRNAANESQEVKAKIFWEDAKEQLKAAQKELAALTPGALIKVLFPLNPIPKLAGYSHFHHRDPCLFSIALEPGSKRQAT